MLTRENILKAKNNLEKGIGGGNTTQICIEALEYILEHRMTEYPLMRFAADYVDGEEDTDDF